MIQRVSSRKPLGAEGNCYMSDESQQLASGRKQIIDLAVGQNQKKNSSSPREYKILRRPRKYAILE